MLKKLRVYIAIKQLAYGCETGDDVAVKLQAMDVTGIQRVPNECPIAVYINNRTGLNVKVNRISIENSFSPIKMPWVLASFVSRFDNGRYPNLISVSAGTGRKDVEDA